MLKRVKEEKKLSKEGSHGAITVVVVPQSIMQRQGHCVLCWLWYKALWCLLHPSCFHIIICKNAACKHLLSISKAANLLRLVVPPFSPSFIFLTCYDWTRGRALSCFACSLHLHKPSGSSYELWFPYSQKRGPTRANRASQIYCFLYKRDVRTVN